MVAVSSNNHASIQPSKSAKVVRPTKPPTRGIGATTQCLTEKRLLRLEENSHLLKPPINNYCVYNDDFTVMVSVREVQSLLPFRHIHSLVSDTITQIVGGPNARTDYHM